MKIFQLANIGAATASDLYAIAVNKLECNGLDSFTLYVDKQTGNETLLTTEVAGNNDPIATLTPEFFPFATKGAECAAVVADISWADSNLNDYEYIVGDDGAGNAKYIVFGELNSSKTDFNDPFGPAQAGERRAVVDTAVCWQGVNASNFPH